MIKIGGVSLDVSHPKAFSECMEKYCMDMRYVYEHNPGFRTREEEQWFLHRFRLTAITDTIEEMVDKVDVGFIQSCNWDKHLDQAMPFLKKGKPVFIDKPIVGSMADIQRLRELTAGGAKIMGASAVRYVGEIRRFLEAGEEKRGRILTVYGTTGTDEFNYAIHIVEAMSELAGAKAESCQYLGEARTEDGQRCQNFSIEYANGVRGIYSSCLDVWQPFVIVVVTTTSVYHFEIDLDQMYLSLLREIYGELERGESHMADVETLINCTEIMLCGKKSRDEQNGRRVTLEQLGPEDRFDGSAFEKEYAVTANRNVYKDPDSGK